MCVCVCVGGGGGGGGGEHIASSGTIQACVGATVTISFVYCLVVCFLK